jgi:hypothetical protein
MLMMGNYLGKAGLIFRGISNDYLGFLSQEFDIVHIHNMDNIRRLNRMVGSIMIY